MKSFLLPNLMSIFILFYFIEFVIEIYTTFFRIHSPHVFHLERSFLSQCNLISEIRQIYQRITPPECEPREKICPSKRESLPSQFKVHLVGRCAILDEFHFFHFKRRHSREVEYGKYHQEKSTNQSDEIHGSVVEPTFIIHDDKDGPNLEYSSWN